MKIRAKVIGALTLTLLVAVTLSGCWVAQEVGDLVVNNHGMPPYGVITSQQAADMILALQDDPEFVLLDIRTPAEVEAGHISGAINLDYYSSTFRDDLALLDRDKIYLIYCRTANRSGQAYNIMEEIGFERVYDMGGGISQWLSAGYPIHLGPLDAEHTCTGELPQTSDETSNLG